MPWCNTISVAERDLWTEHLEISVLEAANSAADNRISALESTNFAEGRQDQCPEGGDQWLP